MEPDRTTATPGFAPSNKASGARAMLEHADAGSDGIDASGDRDRQPATKAKAIQAISVILIFCCN